LEDEDPTITELLGSQFFKEKTGPNHMSNVAMVRIKASHHRIARLCATGASNIEVAQACGYTPQYISNLLTANPAFKELVAHYSRLDEAELLDLRAKQARLGELAVDELTDRIADKPDLFSIRELIDVVESSVNKPRLAEMQKGWTSSGPPSPITISFVTANEEVKVIEGEKK
jgi:hypothetical protein